MKQKYFQIKAQGDSMFPLLQNGDTVEYIEIPFRSIVLNDIILIYSNGILVTHRVVYKTKTTCITRGDNNPIADPIIQKGRILAKVVRFKRKGIWHGLQDVYFIQSALYLNEIQKLETILRTHNIPHVFLKGVLVSLRYEGAIPKRIYADCDILVSRNDSKRIDKIFKILGYELQERSFLRSARCFDYAPAFVKTTAGKQDDSRPEMSYVKRVNGISVVFDVHFEPVFLMTQLGGMNFLYPKRLLTQLGDHIIKGGEIKKIKGFYYSLCTVSDQILYLALHIFHHNFTDSIRYQLLDAVIRKGFNDWKELAQTIKEYKLEGYVYGVFVLLKRYFKTPIPSSFFSAICPPSYKLQVLSYKVQHIDIFSQDSRTKAGVKRFILIFLLSPEPLWKKIVLFIHPEVIYTIFKIALDKRNTIRL